MMPDRFRFLAWSTRHQAPSGALLWLGVALLALFPAPLVPVARLYHALCVPFPALAILGRLAPPLPLGLLLLLLGVVIGSALVSGLWQLIGARRLGRAFDHLAAPVPLRLEVAARRFSL